MKQLFIYLIFLIPSVLCKTFDEIIQGKWEIINPNSEKKYEIIIFKNSKKELNLQFENNPKCLLNKYKLQFNKNKLNFLDSKNKTIYSFNYLQFEDKFELYSKATICKKIYEIYILLFYDDDKLFSLNWRDITESEEYFNDVHDEYKIFEEFQTLFGNKIESNFIQNNLLFLLILVFIFFIVLSYHLPPFLSMY